MLSAVLISHDKFKFGEKLNSRLLWCTVKPLCKSIEGDDAVLILDDSIEAKSYSKCNGLISYHFDHTVGQFERLIFSSFLCHKRTKPNVFLAFDDVQMSKLRQFEIQKNNSRLIMNDYLL